VSSIDWSKAGKRIRHQPKDAFGRNPDWDLKHQRWKDEADYYADELDANAVAELVDCPNCPAKAGYHCGMHGSNCTPRIRAAGEKMLAERGPRFS
jgi:hypothetical protein